MAAACRNSISNVSSRLLNSSDIPRSCRAIFTPTSSTNVSTFSPLSCRISHHFPQFPVTTHSELLRTGIRNCSPSLPISKKVPSNTFNPSHLSSLHPENANTPRNNKHDNPRFSLIYFTFYNISSSRIPTQKTYPLVTKLNKIIRNQLTLHPRHESEFPNLPFKAIPRNKIIQNDSKFYISG